MRPSQDNHDPVVKKLEMGSNVTSSAHQQGQKRIKHKILWKKCLEHIKCFKCLEKGHYARNCQIMSDKEAQLSRNQKKLPENRMDARNWGIWFTAVHRSAGLTRPVRPVVPHRSDRSYHTGQTGPGQCSCWTYQEAHKKHPCTQKDY